MIQVGEYYILHSFDDVMHTKEIVNVYCQSPSKNLCVINIKGTLYEIIPPKNYPAIYTIDGVIFRELDDKSAKEVYVSITDEINATEEKLKKLEKLKECISKKYFGTV